MQQAVRKMQHKPLAGLALWTTELETLLPSALTLWVSSHEAADNALPEAEFPLPEWHAANEINAAMAKDFCLVFMVTFLLGYAVRRWSCPVSNGEGYSRAVSARTVLRRKTPSFGSLVNAPQAKT